jgi:uncharacterized Tic20 family protein
MVVESKPASTHDEKLMAVASHASIALFFIGPLTMMIPLMIWLIENSRDRSSGYVRFHAKQAFFYQLAVYIAALALAIVVGLLSLIGIGGLLSPFLALGWILVIGYGIWGARQVWIDQNFRYLYIADFIEAGEKK